MFLYALLYASVLNLATWQVTRIHTQLNKREFTNHEKLLAGQKYNVKLNNLAWVYSEYHKLWEILVIKTLPNITENLIYIVNLSYETGNYSRHSCHLFSKSGLFWLFCWYLKRQLRLGWWGTPQTFFKRGKKDVPLFYVVNNFKIKYHNVEHKLLSPLVPADEASVRARH